MEQIPQSGLYYPNKIARLMLSALEDIMGKNGVNAILNLASLPDLIEAYPPDNLDRAFDFSNLSSINAALEEMYGPRGGRGLALRGGRAGFAGGLRDFGALSGAGDIAFKILPLEAKLKIGLPAMAKIFTQVSDQRSTVQEMDDHFVYTMHKCPICWGRKSEKPICHMAVGLAQECVKWIASGQDLKVYEKTCFAAGDEACTIIVEKKPSS